MFRVLVAGLLALQVPLAAWAVARSDTRAAFVR